MNKYVQGKIDAYKRILDLINELDAEEYSAELFILKKRIEAVLTLYSDTDEQKQDGFRAYLASVGQLDISEDESDTESDDDLDDNDENGPIGYA